MALADHTDTSLPLSQRLPFRSALKSNTPRPSRDSSLGSGTARRHSLSPLSMSPPSLSPPKNFSWVEPGRLCGMGRPETAAHYGFLRRQGVRHLVTLCEDRPPGCQACPWLELCHVPVVDFTPPTPEQIQGFLSVVEKANAQGEAVGVHCMLGQGRTGTMLACYLVRTRGMTAAEAIGEVRRLRPGSIETPEQEEAVDRFSKMKPVPQ